MATNPLQCSFLENPRDGGAWRAAIYEVAESDTTEATQQQQQAVGTAVILKGRTIKGIQSSQWSRKMLTKIYSTIRD